MELTVGDNVKPDAREVGLDRAETDDVSRWIRMLAIGMMVLGVVFAVLDGCELLPLPGPVAVADPA
jgi:hypothetical protein